MSQFVVSARKYRPTTFDEVVGQNHVAKTLKNALQTDQLAHAFLFCGPRGVGKTTCARILAKVINCQQPVDGVEPCNTCSSCQSFNDNASFNIFELDAASNNSVEHIRTLIEQVRFQPQQGTHKVFIIDEVHMLSTQAFNAFLKTLEEPPPYAIFILATTEKHKILPTILSRCQIFDFKRIQPADIVVQLKDIAGKEGKTADDEALHQIAMKADGAMRDALSIFDKVVSASGNHLTYQDVVVNLNLLDYDYFFKAVDAALRSDIVSLLMLFDEVMKNGFEPELFVQGLAQHLRDILVSKDDKTITLIEGSKELKQRYYNQAKIASESFLLSGSNMMHQCDLALPRANNKRLHIELALSKLCYLNQLVETDVFASGSPQEKKTPELNQLSQKTPGLSQTKIPAPPSPEAVKPSEPIIDHKLEKDLEPEPNSTSTLQVEKTPTQSASVKVTNEASFAETKKNTTPSVVLSEDKESESSSSLDLAIPTAFGGSAKNKLAAIKKKINEEDEVRKVAQNRLSLENVKVEWNKYVEEHTSQSFKAAMKHVDLKLINNHVTATVPSPVTKGFILQEGDLIDGIRETFGTPNLTLDIVIDKSQFPDIEEEEVVKTYFTSSEALKELSQKNPLIFELMKKFELKIDDGQS